MSKPVSFDTFLSHNSKNKPVVRELKQRLLKARLTVWFDEDELRPGIPWQELLEVGLRASKSVVVIVGADGLGPWEDEEMQGILRLAVKDRRPVIPVLLTGCTDAPDLPIFLGNRTWVDLRHGFTDDGIGKLLWGITGKKPKSSADTLVASGPAEEIPDANETEAGDLRAPASTPPPVPRSLNELLPGTWQVQIQLPYQPGVMAQLHVELLPQGLFRGQLTNPMGVIAVEGQWQADPLANQIGLQGIQTNGFQTIPYAVIIQVTGFNPQQIAGVTSGGEQVLWHRVGPPATPPMIPGQRPPKQPR